MIEPSTDPIASNDSMFGLSAAERIAAVEYAALGAPFPQANTLLIEERGTHVAAIHPVGDSLRLWLRRERMPAGMPAMLARLGRRMGVREVRTQGKIATRGTIGRALVAGGFAGGEPSHVFEVDVPTAVGSLAHLSPLSDRLRAVLPGTLEGGAEAVADTLDAAQILDRFELEARLRGTGAGSIALSEGAGAWRGNALAGMVLVARGEAANAREIVARWVAPDMPGRALVNLMLLHRCLARAARAGVVRARFRANPARHADTLNLVRRIGARRVGEIAGFALSLETAP